MKLRFRIEDSDRGRFSIFDPPSSILHLPSSSIAPIMRYCVPLFHALEAGVNGLSPPKAAAAHCAKLLRLPTVPDRLVLLKNETGSSNRRGPPAQ